MTTKGTGNFNFNFDGDNLVYFVRALPGGCDGLDPTDRGGLVEAFLTEAEAKKYIGLDTRYEIKVRPVNGPELKRGLRKKLTLVELLYLKCLGVEL